MTSVQPEPEHHGAWITSTPVTPANEPAGPDGIWREVIPTEDPFTNDPYIRVDPVYVPEIDNVTEE